MAEATDSKRPGKALWFVVTLAIALAAMLGFSSWSTQKAGTAVKPPPLVKGAQAPAPPPVEPLELRDVAPDTAREINAAVPFSKEPNPAARPFHFGGDLPSLARATDCLASAMIYEAGDDPKGERAVGQVVLNRVRHPAFPKTVCGVVFQGSERTTGCQFTFTCNGALARTPGEDAWQRARRLASAMLAGEVYSPVGYSTHYHTDWVVPYWSASLEKVSAVDTHLFFRWPGWWGTPGAFQNKLPKGEEPAIGKLAFLSVDHRAGDPALAGTEAGLLPPGSLINDSATPMIVDGRKVGMKVAEATLLAVDGGENTFAVLLDSTPNPRVYEQIAARFCAGRAQCRLLGWTSARQAPRSFPLNDASVNAMSYAYMRVKASGLERSLYNCGEFKGAPVGQCMRDRVVTATAGSESAGPKPVSDKNKSLLLADHPELAPPTSASGAH